MGHLAVWLFTPLRSPQYWRKLSFQRNILIGQKNLKMSTHAPGNMYKVTQTYHGHIILIERFWKPVQAGGKSQKSIEVNPIKDQTSRQKHYEKISIHF